MTSSPHPPHPDSSSPNRRTQRSRNSNKTTLIYSSVSPKWRNSSSAYRARMTPPRTTICSLLPRTTSNRTTPAASLQDSPTPVPHPPMSRPSYQEAILKELVLNKRTTRLGFSPASTSREQSKVQDLLHSQQVHLIPSPQGPISRRMPGTLPTTITNLSSSHNSRQ